MPYSKIISIDSYNTENMVFAKPIFGEVPGTPIKYAKVNIATRMPDGSVIPLHIATVPKLVSLGITENFNSETKSVNGHSLCMFLTSKDGATTEEKQWLNNFNKIIEKAKSFVIENKKELKKASLQLEDLRHDFSPLWYKQEDGEPVGEPTLYVKLIETWGKNKKLEKIHTRFFNQYGKQINPLDMIKKMCRATAVIKIESIYIGSKIRVQLKLSEVVVEIKKTLATTSSLFESGIIKKEEPVDGEETDGEDNEEEMEDVKLTDEDASSITSDTEEVMSSLLEQHASVEEEAPKPVAKRVIPRKKN